MAAALVWFAVLAQPPPGQIEHVVLLLMENRPFDHFYGWAQPELKHKIDGLDGQCVPTSPDRSFYPKQRRRPGYSHGTTETGPWRSRRYGHSRDDDDDDDREHVPEMWREREDGWRGNCVGLALVRGGGGGGGGGSDLAASLGRGDEAAVAQLRERLRAEPLLGWVEAIDVEQALCEFSKYEAYRTAGVAPGKRFVPDAGCCGQEPKKATKRKR